MENAERTEIHGVVGEDGVANISCSGDHGRILVMVASVLSHIADDDGVDFDGLVDDLKILRKKFKEELAGEEVTKNDL